MTINEIIGKIYRDGLAENQTNFEDIKQKLKEIIIDIINIPLRTGDMTEDDEIIEDTIYDAFVRANQMNALEKIFE